MGEKFDIEPSPGFSSWQQAFRKNEDDKLTYAREFIDIFDDNFSRGEFEQDPKLDLAYRALMIERQVVVNNLSIGSQIIPKMVKGLEIKFGQDVSHKKALKYAVEFMDMVCAYENKIDDLRNVYLLVNEGSSEINNPFPASPILQLNDWGIVGRQLDHSFIHFPVINYGMSFESGSLSVIRTSEDSERHHSLEDHRDIAVKYFEKDRFLGPKVAITTPDKMDYVKKLFEDQGAYVMALS